MKIVINAPTVSGDHARLSVVDSTLYCEDLVRRVQRRTEGRRAAPMAASDPESLESRWGSRGGIEEGKSHARRPDSPDADTQDSTNGTILNGKKMKRGTAYPVKVGSSIIFGDKNLASYKVSEEPDEDGPADPAPSGTIKVDGEDAKKDDEPDYSW